MAAINYDSALAGSKATAGDSIFARFSAKIAEFRLRRQTKSELEALSDDMLRDIGISRGEINDVVNSL